MPLTASSASQPDAPRPVRACLDSFRDAWAHWREATEQAPFAAVMGYALPRGTRPDGYSVHEHLARDWELESAISTATQGATQGEVEVLRRSIEDHITWILDRAIDEQGSAIAAIQSQGMETWFSDRASRDRDYERSNLLATVSEVLRCSRLWARVRVAVLMR